MSRTINLIFNVTSSGDKVKVRIENVARDIDYTIAIGGSQIRFKSSLRPEWDIDNPDVLFLQGSDTEFDNAIVEISRKSFKYFLFAIWKYNSQFTNDDAWLDKHKFKCKYCNGIKSVKHYDQENFEYCLDCKSELKICKDCGKLGAEYLFGTDYYCTNCVAKDNYCQLCETDHLVTRQVEFSVDNNYHGSTQYANICVSCYGKLGIIGTELNYTYKPKIFNFLDYDFKKSQVIKLETPLKNVIYMGTEIEAQFNRKSHVNIVLGKILDLDTAYDCEVIYAKHDGTIPDPGSEIVTHPMTLNMFRSVSWEGLFDNIIIPENFGIGGHIHINKTAFVSPLHVYKFCKFIRTNIKYIEWVAERPLQSDWCKSWSENGRVTQIAKRFKNNNNNDRYEMINFTRDTIELRFFWSPSNTGMLLKNVEFVDALYNYSRDTKLHFDYMEFESYVDKLSIKYPYLYNFILSRNKDTKFGTNAENYSNRMRTTVTLVDAEADEVASNNYECSWCEEAIEEGEEIEDCSNFYHACCYNDMVDHQSEED